MINNVKFEYLLALVLLSLKNKNIFDIFNLTMLFSLTQFEKISLFAQAFKTKKLKH